MDSSFSRQSPGFYHFPVLTLILPFSEPRPDCFSKVAWILPFTGTRPDSTIFQYSHWFYPFRKLVRTVFQRCHGFFLFSVLAQILPFLEVTLILSFYGTHTDSTIFRNSSGQFFKSGMDSSFSQHSPGFDHFSVFTLILPFSETRSNSFSKVQRILPFLGTRTNSTIFGSHTNSTLLRYSHWFYHFSMLVRTVFQ